MSAGLPRMHCQVLLSQGSRDTLQYRSTQGSHQTCQSSRLGCLCSPRVSLQTTCALSGSKGSSGRDGIARRLETIELAAFATFAAGVLSKDLHVFAQRRSYHGHHGRAHGSDCLSALLEYHTPHIVACMTRYWRV